MNFKNALSQFIVVSAVAVWMSSCGSARTAAAPQPSDPSPAPASASVRLPAAQPAATGFVTVTASPVTELEAIQKRMESRNIPSGIGIGESIDEMIARNMSIDQARAELANSISVQVQRISESYAQNVGNEAKQMWEEAVRQMSNETLRGSYVYRSITQYNERTGSNKIYSLIILNPAGFKQAIETAIERTESEGGNAEFSLRMRKDDLLSKMDAAIADYEANKQ